jgi:two-component system response regulator PilR (NtrC family)
MNSRLLVVDDEPELLAEIVSYLRRRGETVTQASCFADARTILQSEPVDIVITDVRMPDGSGVDLARDLMDEGGSHRRCILMTGHVDPTEGVRELNRAGIRILYKPFALSELHREVVRAKESLCADSAAGGGQA